MKKVKTAGITSCTVGEGHYQNIFNAICDKDGYITKMESLNNLYSAGIVNNDPRISKLISRLDKFSRVDKIDLELFMDISSDSIGIIEKSINKGFIIPDFETFKDEITAIFEETKENRLGKNASYIPQLARVDPELFAVVFCSIDG